MNIKLRGFIFLCMLVGIISCADDPPKEEPPPPPTEVIINFHAAENINLDPFGRSSPVMVKIYQLKRPDAFTAADFYKLNEKEHAVLGPDLLSFQEALIRPSQLVKIEPKIDQDTAYIGLIAAFRDLDHASWRQILEAPSHKKTIYEIQLEKVTIKLIPDKKS